MLHCLFDQRYKLGHVRHQDNTRTSMASVRVRLFLDCRPSTRNSHTRCDSNTPQHAFSSSLCCARMRSCEQQQQLWWLGCHLNVLQGKSKLDGRTGYACLKALACTS